MRRCVWIVSIACVLACTFGLVAAAAAGEAEEQGGLFIVEDVTVNPDGVAAYEAASKKFIPLMAEYGFPYSYEAYATDDFHYYFVYPIKNFADIDALYAAWMKFLEAWGMDKWEEMQKDIAGSVESSLLSVYRLRGDLSYLPEENAFDNSKPSYIYWGLCEVKPGMEKAFEKSFKDFVDLFTAKEIPSGWATYQAYFGTEMPAYVYAEWGESPAAFWTQAEKTHEKVEDEAMALWKDTMGTLRRYEFKTGRNRPDLSYKPAMKEASEE